MYPKLYNFKQQIQDFQVSEVLNIDPVGTGEVFYILIKKENLNTMDILAHLQAKTGLMRNDFGIAGLKDKKAITIQRLSIYKSRLSKAGGEKVFLKYLEDFGVEILKTTRGETPLFVGANKGNTFKIRLRATKEINKENFDDIKQIIGEKIEHIIKIGFPNAFGTQRFGKQNRNFHLSKRVFEENLEGKGDSDFHIRFKLQAYASMYFNHYCIDRYNKGQRFMQGDIVMNGYHLKDSEIGLYENGEIKLFDYRKCKEEREKKDFFYPENYQKNIIDIAKSKELWISTGPIIGWNLLLPPNGSKSFIRERNILKKTDFNLHGFDISKKYNIFGIRRPLFVYPENLKYEFISTKESDNTLYDINISFFLPVGSYATTLLSYIFRDISPKTNKENGLNIPNIIE